jgi:hypothetical protein
MQCPGSFRSVFESMSFRQSVIRPFRLRGIYESGGSRKSRCSEVEVLRALESDDRRDW